MTTTLPHPLSVESSSTAGRSLHHWLSRSLSRRLSAFGGSRGSLLAAGVPIALVLTGLIWYLIGVSNSVLEAQSLRFEADRTAYEAAVLHARGMNVIATLNILMRSLASVVVAWGLFSNSIVFVETLCYAPGSTCDPAVADAVRKKVEAATPAVDAWTKAQIATLGQLQRLTATVTPTIAFNHSPPTSTLVSYSIPYSTSMVPDARIAAIMGSVSTPRWGLSSDLPSLPVQSAVQADFCAASGPPVWEVGEKLLIGIKEPWIFPLLVGAGYDYKKFYDSAGTKSGCLGVSGEAAGIWDAASGANPDYRFAFQVYGFAFGKDAAHELDDRNVSTLVGDGSPAPRATLGWAASSAEFFFPCTTGWASCANASVIEPAWQAQLSRVRPLPGGADLLTTIASNLNVSAPGGATKVLSSAGVWKRVADFVH